jgi:hypothetical protein
MKSIFQFCFISALFVVQAFLKIQAQEINHWEMIVSAGDTWNYFVAYQAPPQNWADSDFDATLWSSGPGGIGYGEGNEGTNIPETPAEYTTVYIRNIFNIVDNSVIADGILHIDFDDAFVAYLNGHEIARANIGTIGVRPTYNELALNCDYEAQLSKGGIPAAFSVNKDTIDKYLVSGANVLAVEVHNCSTGSSDLASTTYFSLGITDESHNYRELPSWLSSNLPLLLIHTDGQEIVDNPKIKAWLKVIDNGTGKPNYVFQNATGYDGYIGIEVRGQSSQMFPKKNMGFETWNADSSGLTVSLLGMPEE